MNEFGVTISKVVVTGSGKPDATLIFGPALNVVAGASNTGKTYAWQLIDFMLGAARSPKTIPYAVGYSHAYIEILSRDSNIVTMSRALSGGSALAYAAGFDAISSDLKSTLLAEKHDANDPNTISGALLQLIGLWDRQVRKNEYGEKRSLSFRDVAWLTLVDEERIITERSPVLSGEYTTPTQEKSAFGLFLTGTDDAAIVAQERPKDRKQRLELQMTLLQGLLDDREGRLKPFAVEQDQLANQRNRLANAIAEATDLLATQQSELDLAADERDRAWSTLQEGDSHRLFLLEQIKRMELLREHYKSDAARLESTLEAGELMERLPQGECPVCGHQQQDNAASHADDTQLQEFQKGCKAELAKIGLLRNDLETSLAQLTAEDARLIIQQQDLRNILTQSNTKITDLLRRRDKTANEQLSSLLTQQARLSEAAFIVNEIADLRTRFSVVEQQSKQKVSRPKLSKKVEAAGMTEFCKVVEATLRAWKFPFTGNVSWSDDYFDLIIGGENRGAMGKGFRAVTHAAFTVSLMRYCRDKGLPHPGVVILDTPLNPYKGADKSAKEGANMEVQEAFYANLADDASGDQVIVFENTEPPPSVRGKLKYTHFSGNPTNPPAGFYPVGLPIAPAAV